jgi:hypothetical protein
MVTWVLIVFAHVGAMGDGNSNALTNVPGFGTAQECQTAGESVKKLARGTVKSIDFVCVQQTRK